jgi:Xaa-Pro dipeptidase
MCADDVKQRARKIFENAASLENSGPGEAEGSKELEALFIYNSNGIDKNFFYLTGLSGGVFENCGVVAEKEGRIILITTALEEELSRGAAAYDDIVIYRDEDERERSLKQLLCSYRKVGVAYDRIPHSLFCRLRELSERTEWQDVSSAFRRVRMVKSPREIEKIRCACRTAEKVAALIPSMLEVGMMEVDLGAEIDYQIKRQGGNASAFNTIVAFGENTSKPHYGGGRVRLESGTHVLVDFGAEYEGYHSDITRIYFTGRPQAGLIELYGTVNDAKELALSLIKAGVSAHPVEEQVKELIESHDCYRGKFIHSLGHSLGLDVHDDSYPIKSHDGRFCENMVLTVEPGVYLPGLYGIRLEDDIVVEKKGCALLTSPVKEPETYEI